MNSRLALWCGLLCVVLLAAVHVAAYGVSGTPILDVTPDILPSLMRSDRPVLLLLYAGWCDRSQRFIRHFRKAAVVLQDGNLDTHPFLGKEKFSDVCAEPAQTGAAGPFDRPLLVQFDAFRNNHQELVEKYGKIGTPYPQLMMVRRGKVAARYSAAHNRNMPIPSVRQIINFVKRASHAGRARRFREIRDVFAALGRGSLDWYHSVGVDDVDHHGSPTVRSAILAYFGTDEPPSHFVAAIDEKDVVSQCYFAHITAAEDVPEGTIMLFHLTGGTNLTFNAKAAGLALIGLPPEAIVDSLPPRAADRVQDTAAALAKWAQSHALPAFGPVVHLTMSHYARRGQSRAILIIPHEQRESAESRTAMEAVRNVAMDWNDQHPLFGYTLSSGRGRHPERHTHEPAADSPILDTDPVFGLFAASSIQPGDLHDEPTSPFQYGDALGSAANIDLSRVALVVTHQQNFLYPQGASTKLWRNGNITRWLRRALSGDEWPSLRSEQPAPEHTDAAGLTRVVGYTFHDIVIMGSSRVYEPDDDVGGNQGENEKRPPKPVLALATSSADCKACAIHEELFAKMANILVVQKNLTMRVVVVDVAKNDVDQEFHRLTPPAVFWIEEAMITPLSPGRSPYPSVKQVEEWATKQIHSYSLRQPHIYPDHEERRKQRDANFKAQEKDPFLVPEELHDL